MYNKNALVSMLKYFVFMDKSFVEVVMKREEFNFSGYFRNFLGSEVGNVCDLSQFIVVNGVGSQNWRPNAVAGFVGGREDFYLIYVVRGGMTILSGREKQSFSKGQIVCFYSHTPYKYASGEDGVFYYWMHFTGHCAKQILESLGILNEVVYTVGENEEIFQAWKDLCAEFLNQNSTFVLRTAAKIVEILAALSDKIDRPFAQLPQKKLAHSIEYIHRNFNEDISIQKLAEIEHLSVSRLYTVFKENIGYSPSEYILALRINHACSLLLQTDMSIKEISVQVGYKDPFYFSRLFKKRVGKSPSTYKKDNMNLPEIKV